MNLSKSLINKKFNFLFNNTILFLILIGVGSLLLRINYFSFEIPVTNDALSYFVYGLDISVIGNLPHNYTPANNGWPIFFSIFFSVFDFQNTLSYMQLQKLLSVIISVLTIIPVYFLSKKFVGNQASLIGATIFAFEPRLIQNSLLGIADPLFIFLSTISLVLFLNTGKKSIYLAFAVVSLACIVRSEGLFLFFALSIMFFIKYRKKISEFPKYILLLGIFLLILFPIITYRIDVTGTDALFMRVIGSAAAISEPSSETLSTETSFIFRGVENFIKFLGWDLIPIFIFFIPIGIFLFLKKINFEKLTLIITALLLSMPAFFAYSIPLPDTRYFYFLYPIFCVVSAFMIQYLIRKFQNPNICMILLVFGIILSSSIFLNFKIYS